MAEAHQVLGEDVGVILGEGDGDGSERSGKATFGEGAGDGLRDFLEMFKEMDGGIGWFERQIIFFLGVITKVEEGDTDFVVSKVELDLERVLMFTGTCVRHFAIKSRKRMRTIQVV